LPDGKLSVLTLDSGQYITIDPKFVRSGVVGYEDVFDIVVGPKTDRPALTQTLTECLSEKGHCVLRFAQSFEEGEAAHGSLRQAEAEGRLGRLAQEVEEGYLGRGCRAKVMWLDPELPGLPEDGLVCRMDAHLTTLAEVLGPVAEEVSGEAVDERMPAMVCSSMTDAEELEYESASATDRQLEEFYMVWKRSVLRICCFVGPATVCARLAAKGASPLLEVAEESYRIPAVPGTVVVFREDCFDYSFEEPEGGERAYWLTTFLLRPMPQWTFGDDLEGDLSVFQVPKTGPRAPQNDLVAVCALSLQACGKMSDHHKEWAAYIAGTDGQLEMPLLRFDYLPYYSEEVDMPQGTTFVKHFSVQDGIELFDNRTFEISNMESSAMDPLCRQVLEVGYLSIFQIGLSKKEANKRSTHASVSVGMDKQEWVNMPGVPSNVATNNQLAIVANRFNYVFNLKGGSYVMDTACSSSLCASHLGKVNLLERRWDPLEWHLGLGTGLTLTVFSFIHGSASHMLSPGGRCFTFNATANGYNRGDGTAAMLLKAGPNDPERWCYFRGSQIGQDGRSASMSAPNGPAQEKCVWGALREARMDPPESTVWECHGTGTSLGDPIEVGAVRKVQIKMKRSEPLMIASSKSNMGHLEGSAAALAMNKCALIVMNIICAPTQHLKCLNPHLDHAAFDAIFNTEATPYLYTAGHCQVSSFGVGGTNGHAIFWGEKFEPPVDPKKRLAEKLMHATTPIIADGPNPQDWEYSGPPFDLKPGERCKVVYTKDPVTGEDEVRFERQQVVADEPAQFFCVTGSHNDWADDRMDDGEAPGVFVHEVYMPTDGMLEFRILADGDQDKAIGPEETTESRSAALVGPGPEVRTSWVVKGAPNACVRIEFVNLTSASGQAVRSITWFTPKT